MARISKAELMRLQKKLGTDHAIGEKLGITRQAVFQTRRLYGMPPLPSKNEERNAKVVALSDKGVSKMAIANKFDLSLSMVYRILDSAGAGKRAKHKGKAGKKRKAVQ
jgi:DNA invertase Pin-like site-specific DNA recombinase